jgi:hypothetical protein
MNNYFSNIYFRMMKFFIFIIICLLFCIQARGEFFLHTYVPFIYIENYPLVRFYLCIRDFEDQNTFDYFNKNYFLQKPEKMSIEIQENDFRIKNVACEFHQCIDKNNGVLVVSYETEFPFSIDRTLLIKFDIAGFHNLDGDRFFFKGSDKKIRKVNVASTSGFETYIRRIHIDEQKISVKNEEYLKLFPPIVIHATKMPEMIFAENSGPGWDEFTCPVIATVSSSSFLQPQGKNIYEPFNLCDRNLKTAWCEGEQNNGSGEWIEFIFAETSGLDGNFSGNFVLVNGYAKNDNTFSYNSRIKTFLCYWNSFPVFKVKLLDTKEPQSFSLSEFNKKNHMLSFDDGDTIRFSISKVFPGSRYHDTCISEFMPRCQP